MHVVCSDEYVFTSIHERDAAGAAFCKLLGVANRDCFNEPDSGGSFPLDIIIRRGMVRARAAHRSCLLVCLLAS